MKPSDDALRAAVFSEDPSVRWDAAAWEHLPVELARLDPAVRDGLIEVWAEAGGDQDDSVTLRRAVDALD